MKNNHTHEAKEKILSEIEHILNYIKNHAQTVLTKRMMLNSRNS